MKQPPEFKLHIKVLSWFLVLFLKPFKVLFSSFQSTFFRSDRLFDLCVMEILLLKWMRMNF